MQGRMKIFFKWEGEIVLNAIFQKGSFCTDFTSYNKCIKCDPKKRGSSDPSDPPLPTPLICPPKRVPTGHTT